MITIFLCLPRSFVQGNTEDGPRGGESNLEGSGRDGTK